MRSNDFENDQTPEDSSIVNYHRAPSYLPTPPSNRHEFASELAEHDPTATAMYEQNDNYNTQSDDLNLSDNDDLNLHR